MDMWLRGRSYEYDKELDSSFQSYTYYILQKLLDKPSFREKKHLWSKINYTKTHKKTKAKKNLTKKTKVCLKTQSGRTGLLDY